MRATSSDNDPDYNGNVSNEPLYTGCWETNDQNTANEEGYLRIVNGGSYKWRPLTRDECYYLMTDASRGAVIGTTENSRYARITVDGVNGLLIFPDSETNIWTEAMGSVPTSINTNGEYSWGTDKYTALNYVAMYNAGMFFLPAAGAREFNNVIGVGTNGDYWSSTGHGSNNVYYLNFYATSVSGENSLKRYYGRCVRLVRDI